VVTTVVEQWGWSSLASEDSTIQWRTQGETDIVPRMDEGRKRVLGIMAAILASLHMERADDLFGGPQGSPRTDKLIAASIQWAEEIMRKIDGVFPK
jgi:hypothetical protein